MNDFSFSRHDIANRPTGHRLANHSSQHNEDEIIDRLLTVLHAPTGWCVEFGAWDGQYMSNTYNLIAGRGFSAVLIEGDTDRFDDLVRTFDGNPRVHPMCKYVGWGERDSLDRILASTAVPENFDVLSIDVDGNDFHIWDAVHRYHPSIVVIEFNPTIPNALDYVQPKNPQVYTGNSLRALVRLGRSKGYELIATTTVNAILVRREHFATLEIDDNSIHALHPEDSDTWVTHLFVGYDGTIHLSGLQRTPWHGLPLNARYLQVVPRPLRGFPPTFGAVRRRLLTWYRPWAWFTRGWGIYLRRRASRTQ